MARGGHGLPKVSLGPAMPKPSMPYGRATPKMALQLFGGWPARRAVGLQPSSSHLDNPCHTPMILTDVISAGAYISRSIHGLLKSSPGPPPNPITLHPAGSHSKTAIHPFQRWPPARQMTCNRLPTPLDTPCPTTLHVRIQQT
jgi:hypothetical protein